MVWYYHMYSRWKCDRTPNNVFQIVIIVLVNNICISILFHHSHLPSFFYFIMIYSFYYFLEHFLYEDAIHMLPPPPPFAAIRFYEDKTKTKITQNVPCLIFHLSRGHGKSLCRLPCRTWGCARGGEDRGGRGALKIVSKNEYFVDL